MNNKLIPDVSQEKQVECLGLMFANEKERREYFKEKLLDALNELEGKLKGVPFTSVSDTVERLKSPTKWPAANLERLEELAKRMQRGDLEKDLLQRWKDEVGFPHGTIEDIVNLSDPPYYTACPNPFIHNFIQHHATPYDPDDDYHREPYAADVSEGKNDPIYNAHTYHTKVPHKAIMRYILHYTKPGDLVFDGFCGTGMTGVAAQLSGDRETVESLGYKVTKDGTILEQKQENGKAVWMPFSKLGPRKAILNDLSPAATFIAYNYNTPVDVSEFEKEAERILAETEKEWGWMYATLHAKVLKRQNRTVEDFTQRLHKAKSVEEIRQFAKDNAGVMGQINYTVWSDVFSCPNCSKEIVFFKAAVHEKTKRVKRTFSCPHCNVDDLTKRRLEAVWVSQYDAVLEETIQQVKQVPVLINYTYDGKRFEKEPDVFDLALLKVIDEIKIQHWFPTAPIPVGVKTAEPLRLGITHAHHFYTRRNLRVIAYYTHACIGMEMQSLRFLMSSLNLHLNIQRRYQPAKPGGTPGLPGTLYISSTPVELSPYDGAPRKLRDLAKMFRGTASTQVKGLCETASASYLLSCVGQYVDYIFTDPPFGANLMYSELNFLWEAWLRVFTNNKEEAIENKVQGKGLVEYQEIMGRCFEEYYRVLKPGRWMTVAFHNSKNSVWNAIQEALWSAGFVVADVKSLDKQQGTFNQVTSSGAVRQNLVISAYKPNEGLEEEFWLKAGTEEGVWGFVRSHLRQLVTVSDKDGALEVQEERRNYMLYDRMVAFHVQRGILVPLSAAEFYAGLEQRFPCRDDMYFLPDQVMEYDKKRMRVRKVQQLALIPRDENSAILWLRQQLSKKPQTFQELHPQFMRESQAWLRFEEPMELMDLLKGTFLMYDGKGPIPTQIVSWLKLSENYRPKVRKLEEKEGALTSLGLETTDPDLIGASKDRWYVPDPNKAADLEKIREKDLLEQFEEYLKSTKKRLGTFRLEAVRAGFKKAWQEKDYETIVKVAEKIRPLVLQEDPVLVRWYHQALTRTGRD